MPYEHTIPPLSGRPFMDGNELSRHFKNVHGITVSPKTLAKLRCIGGGPEFMKFGSRVYYDPNKGEAWAFSKLSPAKRSTSDQTRRAEPLAHEAAPQPTP